MRARTTVSVLTFALLFVMGATVPARAADVRFAVEMASIRFSPDVLRVVPGDSVTVRIFNNDSGVPHTFDLDAFGVHVGTVASPIPAGEERNVTFVADRAGVFYYYCSVPGHATDVGGGRWTGMAGRLEVGAPPPQDTTVIVVSGLVVLAAVAGGVAFLALRKRKKPE